MKPKEVLEKWIDCFNKADAYHTLNPNLIFSELHN